jgi:ubiquinone/menaquinone biosynthesis C-methylase UbiE
LDLGCGLSPVSEGFRHLSSFLVGIDKSRYCLESAKRNSCLDLVLGDATSLPFRDQSFEFVLCNDVLEHVQQQAKLIQELIRVMVQGGAAYIQCANRYQIIEPHFLLPFLSWLPKSLADIYLRITRKGKSYRGYFPKTRGSVLSLTGACRTIDLTYERTLMKIKNLSIQSRLLRRIVSSLRRFLSDESTAELLQRFSIISVLVFKD